MEEPIVGIDLGTTNSLVGVVDAGFPLILADSEGRRMTPSAVFFPAGGEPIAGWSALAHGHRAVTSVKRLIGCRAGEEPVAAAPEKSPVEVSAVILRELKRIAERRMERPVSRAVITVPAFFNDAQRQATKRAGERAGFTVERILSEPTAAALSFGLERVDERAKIAVFDLGGGTFDISVLEMRAGVLQVLATAGDTRLGGDDFDEALAARAHRGGDFDMSWSEVGREDRTRLLEAARLWKHDLSARDSATLNLPFYQGKNLSATLDRTEFNRMLAPWLGTIRRCVWQALTDAKVAPEDLDHVVLAGGSSRVPAVRELVAEIFGKEPLTSENPDESVARGAVIQAGMISGALRELTLLDVTPLSLGVETYGGLMNVIIPRNTTIPVKAGEMFTNASAEQTAMRLRILQGERELARDNWELGRVDVTFQAAVKARARVGVEFSIDADGILCVLARDTATGRDTVLSIQDAAVRVDDAAVEEMIASSVEHAWEDMAERQWTEAALKSRELLTALDAALPLAGDDLAVEERERIASLATESARLLDQGPPALARLKDVTAQLDEATQNLAAALLERALAAEETE